MVQMVHSRTTDVQVNTISCYTCICTVYMNVCICHMLYMQHVTKHLSHII